MYNISTYSSGLKDLVTTSVTFQDLQSSGRPPSRATMSIRQPDNLYLNLTYNPVESSGQFTSHAIFDQTLTEPLLNRASEYYASIIRFRIPTEGIPIMRWPVDTTQNVDANRSILKIGVRNGALKYTQPLIFVPSTIGPNPPPVAGPTIPYWIRDPVASSYYAIFTIDILIRAFNTAIVAAMAAGGLVQPAPYFIYEPVTELISVIVDNAFIAAGLQLYINFDSNNYLESFPFILNLLPTADDNFYFKFDVLPYLGVSPFKFTQEYSAMNLWYDLTKFIITSNSMPIRSESVPIGNTGVVSSTPIFTDFEISFDSVTIANTTAVYNPTSQYRLVDLVADTPIYRINLGFYYQTKNGNIYPIYITKAQQIAIKIGFFRKDLYNNGISNQPKKDEEANRVLTGGSCRGFAGCR